MTRHFILFIGILILTNNLVYGQNSNRCKLIASQLEDSLVFPAMFSDNWVESKLIFGYTSTASDSSRTSFYRKSKSTFLNNLVEKCVRHIETKTEQTTCDCLFVIDFDILYIDSTKTTTYDTILVSSDSLAYILSLHQNSTYYTKVEDGRPLVTTLDSLYKQFMTNYIPFTTVNEGIESKLPKKFGLSSLKSSKDSIAIRIWNINELAFEASSIYRIGLDSKGKVYAKVYSSYGTWEKLNIDENELGNFIIPSLTKLPQHPKYPTNILDGHTYDVEVWINKKYRQYSISNAESIANNYNFWIEKKFLEIMKKITSR